jgi:hypothetical protein
LELDSITLDSRKSPFSPSPLSAALNGMNEYQRILSLDLNAESMNNTNALRFMLHSTDFRLTLHPTGTRACPVRIRPPVYDRPHQRP